MNKVFLYLYPIKEFQKTFTHTDEYYEKENIQKPFPILNECIQKRYREKGYKVIFAMYPNKEIYGIIPNEKDKIIYTDINFEQATIYDSLVKEKENFTPIYPNEEFLLEQIGHIDKLIIGGYHIQDCVKKVAECAYKHGIDTLVDIDLTELFFTLYKNTNYFNISEYSPEKYKENIFNKIEGTKKEILTKIFKRSYSSPIFGFDLKKENNIER